MVLLGRFNGQGLGKSVQDFVSTHLVVNDDDDVRLQGGAVAVRSGEGSAVPLNRRHEPIKVKTGNSKTRGDVQVLVRTSPGAEYIKVSFRGAMLGSVFCLSRLFRHHRGCARQTVIPGIRTRYGL